MEPTFEQAARLTLLGCLTKKAFDISPELLQDPRVVGAMVGGVPAAIVGGLAGRSRGRSGLQDAIRSGLLGAGAGATFGQGVHLDVHPEMYEGVNHQKQIANALMSMGFTGAVGGTVGQMFDRPGTGTASGAAIGLARALR